MDENRVGLMVTKGLHVHLGCGVLTVSSGDKCVGILTHEHKVAFLLDVSLPAVDSFELDVWIHENFSQHFSRPFIVSLTGSREKHSKENCLRAGMDGVVPKPVSVDKMRSALSELLRA